MNMLPKLAGLRKAAVRMRLGWLAAIIVTASVTALVATNLADSKGYDRGLATGHTQGYADGKAEGQVEYNDGYDAGKSAGFDIGKAAGYSAGESAAYSARQSEQPTGYNLGYSAAMNDAVQVIKTYLPPLLQATYANGRASAPIYVPSLDFGSTSIHCTATAYGVSTSVNCY